MYHTYIMASRSRTLYTGVTNNITRRVWEHREGLIPGFTKRYRIHPSSLVRTHKRRAESHRAREGNQRLAPREKDSAN